MESTYLRILMISFYTQFDFSLVQMRDVRHDNLAALVGACVDPGHVCLLVHYCPRGGLQDVLANDDIRLDLTFKISFAVDIIAVGFSFICINSATILFIGNWKFHVLQN